MTNAELIQKIRNEIERRKAYQKQMYERRLPDGRPNYDWAESLAIMRELEELLSFLDTLESEKPMNQDELEKEYQEFCKDYPFPWSSQYVNREYIDELCLSVARHFAQWGAEHLKK